MLFTKVKTKKESLIKSTLYNIQQSLKLCFETVYLQIQHSLITTLQVYSVYKIFYKPRNHKRKYSHTTALIDYFISSFVVNGKVPTSTEPKLKKQPAKISTVRCMCTCAPSPLLKSFFDSCKCIIRVINTKRNVTQKNKNKIRNLFYLLQRILQRRALYRSRTTRTRTPWNTGCHYFCTLLFLQ